MTLHQNASIKLKEEMRSGGGGKQTSEETIGVVAHAAASHQKDAIALAVYASLSSWARHGERAATADTLVSHRFTVCLYRGIKK